MLSGNQVERDESWHCSLPPVGGIGLQKGGAPLKYLPGKLSKTEPAFIRQTKSPNQLPLCWGHPDGASGCTSDSFTAGPLCAC